MKDQTKYLWISGAENNYKGFVLLQGVAHSYLLPSKLEGAMGRSDLRRPNSREDRVRKGMGNVGLPRFCYLDIYKVWIFLHNPSMGHIMQVSEQPSPAPEAVQERRGRKTLEPSRNLQAKCAQGGGGSGEGLACPISLWLRGTKSLFGRWKNGLMQWFSTQAVP